MKFAIFGLSSSVDIKPFPGHRAPRCHPSGPGPIKGSNFLSKIFKRNRV